MQDLNPSRVEELRAASNLLEAALDRYAAACASLAASYNPQRTLQEISQGMPTTVYEEIERVSLHATKFGRAKADVNQIRNLIPSVAPINTLPPDTLSCIFALVLHDHDVLCHHGGQSNSTRFDPDNLAQVCSHWRQVALQSRMLWTHIDLILVTGYRLSEQWLDRCVRFASRSNPLPLDIHIVGQTICRAGDIILDYDARDFLTSIAPRVKSLKIPGSHAFGRMNQTALEICFASCTPMVFNRLVMTGNHLWRSHYPTLIRAWDRPANHVYDGEWDFRLVLPHTQLEDRILHVTVLRLNGVRFPWDSQAYCGLVELRLVPLWGAAGFVITRSLLLGILAGSPGLRALELGVQFIDSLSQDGPNTHLKDLEILDLRTTDCSEYQSIFQLITPGLNPLQLSLKFFSSELFILSSQHTQSFFARSVITELHIRCVSEAEQHMELRETIKSLHTPRLRTLSLENFRLDEHMLFYTQSFRPPSPQATDDEDGLCRRLDALHLTSCSIELDYLRRLTGTFPIRVLRVADCLVWSEAGGLDDAKHHEGELLEAVSVVEFREKPAEMGQWDPWA